MISNEFIINVLNKIIMRPCFFNLMSHRNEGYNRNFLSGRINKYSTISVQPIQDYYANPIRPPEILLKVRAGTIGRRIKSHLLPIPQDAPKRPRNHRHHPLRQETASPRRKVPLRGVLHRPASHRLIFFLCHTDLRSALPLATEGTQDCHTD